MLWKCDVTCSFGDLCELAALHPTLTETLFILSRITTQLVLFVISLDTLCRGTYKWKGTETQVPSSVFRGNSSCHFSGFPLICGEKQSLEEDLETEEPQVLHILKFNWFCKLERQIPMIKTADGITASFTLNCKIRFMCYAYGHKLKYEKFHLNIRKNFLHWGWQRPGTAAQGG